MMKLATVYLTRAPHYFHNLTRRKVMALDPEQMQRELRTLADKVNKDPAITGSGSGAAIAQEITTLAEKGVAYRGDVWFYRLVAGTLGAAILLSLVLAFFLLMNGRSDLDFFTAIGSASVGGLVGLLVPSPVGKG
jgi:hypothetical protein